MKNKHEKVLARYAKAKSRNMHFDRLYNEAFKWFMPDKENAENYALLEGGKNRNHIYDNTAEEAINTFASRVGNLAFPYGREFLEFKLNKITEYLFEVENVDDKSLKLINNALSEITSILFKYIDNSNFYPVLNESLKDYGVGTGSFIINELDDPYRLFTFTSINPNTLAIEETSDNLPKSVFREYQKTIKAFMELYPDALLNEEMKKELKENPNTDVSVKECLVHKEKDDEPPYTLYVFLNDKVVYEEEMISNPYIVFRYGKNSEEVKGRGPALMSVDDVKVLNSAVKHQMKVAEKSVSEIFLIGAQNTFNNKLLSKKNKDGTITLEDDMLIPVTDVKEFTRLPFNGNNVIINETFINRLEFKIKNRMLAGTVERSDSITRAPEEIQSINAERAEDLNSMFARLDLELMKPMVDRVLDIMIRNGVIDKQLSVLQEYGIPFDAITISYNSPISKAKDLEDVNNFVQAFQTTAANLGQEVALSTINVPQASNYIYKKFGVDSKLFLSVKEMEKIIQQQQQQQQQMMQAQAQAMQQEQQGEGNNGSN